MDAEEERLAPQLARSAGIEQVVVDATPDWPAAIDALLAAHAGPVGGADTPVVQLAVARAAADGPVALAGAGGDEVFGGSAAVRAGEQVRHFRRLPRSEERRVGK